MSDEEGGQEETEAEVLQYLIDVQQTPGWDAVDKRNFGTECILMCALQRSTLKIRRNLSILFGSHYL